MTLEELLKIIKEKRQNAEIDRERHKGCSNLLTIGRLNGEIEAYTDLICLIESKMGKEE